MIGVLQYVFYLIIFVFIDILMFLFAFLHCLPDMQNKTTLTPRVEESSDDSSDGSDEEPQKKKLKFQV